MIIWFRLKLTYLLKRCKKKSLNYKIIENETEHVERMNEKKLEPIKWCPKTFIYNFVYKMKWKWIWFESIPFYIWYWQSIHSFFFHLKNFVEQKKEKKNGITNIENGEKWKSEKLGQWEYIFDVWLEAETLQPNHSFVVSIN